LQLLLVFIGAAIGANIYVTTAGVIHGVIGNWIRVGIAAFPFLLALVATLISVAHRTLGEWLVLAFLYYRKQRLVPWKSVCRQDNFARLPREASLDQQPRKKKRNAR
jgi:hypothetical protein